MNVTVSCQAWSPVIKAVQDGTNVLVQWQNGDTDVFSYKSWLNPGVKGWPSIKDRCELEIRMVLGPVQIEWL